MCACTLRPPKRELFNSTLPVWVRALGLCEAPRSATFHPLHGDGAFWGAWGTSSVHATMFWSCCLTEPFGCLCFHSPGWQATLRTTSCWVACLLLFLIFRAEGFLRWFSSFMQSSQVSGLVQVRQTHAYLLDGSPVMQNCLYLTIYWTYFSLKINPVGSAV